MKKNKKNCASLVDLSERKNITIIPLPKKDKQTLDAEMEFFKKQLKSRSKESEEFYNYYIEKQVREATEISDDYFESTMKSIMKEHKILKSLIKEQEN